jgi:hypothetical protein
VTRAFGSIRSDARSGFRLSFSFMGEPPLKSIK